MTRHTSSVFVVLVLLGTALGSGCTQFSVRERDNTAGLNGSFEVARSGLPVNWYFHKPPLEQGDAELMLDETDPVDGRRAVKLLVHRTDGAGYRTAGMFQTIDAEPNRTYRVSFWIRNEGAIARVSIYSELPKDESSEPVVVMTEPGAGGPGWQRYERLYTVPEAYSNVRFQLDVRTSGTVWIDDVRIEPIG